VKISEKIEAEASGEPLTASLKLRKAVSFSLREMLKIES